MVGDGGFSTHGWGREMDGVRSIYVKVQEIVDKETMQGSPSRSPCVFTSQPQIKPPR